jgi:chromosome segregation ATPase
MFSHLEALNNLGLLENQCIDKSYSEAASKFSTVEADLKDCGINLAIQETGELSNNLEIISERISGLEEGIESLIEEKFGGIQDLMNNLKEANDKVNATATNLEENFKTANEKINLRFEELERRIEAIEKTEEPISTKNYRVASRYSTKK